MADRESAFDRLEAWSPTLLVAGGVLVILYAAGLAVMDIVDTELYRTLTDGAGYTLAFLGLLGLYPALADRSPRTARLGAVLAVLGVVGFALLFVEGVFEIAGATPPAWDPVKVPAAMLGTLFGWLVFGAASLRTDFRSRRFGLVLLAPSVLMMLNFVRVAIQGMHPLAAVTTFGEGLAFVAVGYMLRGDAGTATGAQVASPEAGG